MSFLQQNNLRLGARNEGKIKTYESCCDIRAWSHNSSVKDRYLRDWIRSDMPICIIPASTLSSFLRTMTCKSCRRQATPRCHPNCKSNELLQSICTSCHAVKECLLQDENFDKYFVEEDLETSHWPCDRCLEALKSIKMFWKIIVDKIFNINLSKYDMVESKFEDTNNVRSITKVWQSEIQQQTLIVKNIRPGIRRAYCNILRYRTPKQEIPESPPRITLSHPIEKNHDPIHICDSKCFLKCRHSNQADEKVHRTVCTSVSNKMIDVGCDTCEFEKNEHDKNSKMLKVLREKYILQNKEMESLKQENNSLRTELEKFYKCCQCNTSCYAPGDQGAKPHTVTVIPKPFEGKIDDNDPAKNIDSEVIITMKKCKNESFRHVSLLQVLHKTNDPMLKDLNQNGPCSQKEDPIEILNKVQNTFGAIVKREICLVNEKRSRPRKTEVDATFQRINASRSDPSCSAFSSGPSSEADFISTKDGCDKDNISIVNF